MRIGVPVLVILLALAGSLALLLARSARSGEAMPMGGHAMHDMAMSDADMARTAAAYWAAHTPVGLASNVPLATTAVSDTVVVENFLFDFDGNTGTQIDTVKVLPGDQVVWKWIAGTHTVTSGTGNADPNAGAIFNSPSDLTHTLFSFTFSTPGTFPYFCTFHDGLFNMKGVVVVQDLSGVEGTVGTGIGFASHPWPNPARGSVSFRYDVKQAGRVRAEVLDVRGRVVALVVNEDQPVGTYSRAWDGRLRGAPAPAGRYFLRLTVPGYLGTQAVTLTR